VFFFFFFVVVLEKEDSYARFPLIFFAN